MKDKQLVSAEMERQTSPVVSAQSALRTIASRVRTERFALVCAPVGYNLEASLYDVVARDAYSKVKMLDEKRQPIDMAAALVDIQAAVRRGIHLVVLNDLDALPPTQLVDALYSLIDLKTAVQAGWPPYEGKMWLIVQSGLSMARLLQRATEGSNGQSLGYLFAGNRVGEPFWVPPMMSDELEQFPKDFAQQTGGHPMLARFVREALARMGEQETRRRLVEFAIPLAERIVADLRLRQPDALIYLRETLFKGTFVATNARIEEALLRWDVLRDVHKSHKQGSSLELGPPLLLTALKTKL